MYLTYAVVEGYIEGFSYNTEKDLIESLKKHEIFDTSNFDLHIKKIKKPKKKSSKKKKYGDSMNSQVTLDYYMGVMFRDLIYDPGVKKKKYRAIVTSRGKERRLIYEVEDNVQNIKIFKNGRIMFTNCIDEYTFEDIKRPLDELSYLAQQLQGLETPPECKITKIDSLSFKFKFKQNIDINKLDILLNEIHRTIIKINFNDIVDIVTNTLLTGETPDRESILNDCENSNSTKNVNMTPGEFDTFLNELDISGIKTKVMLLLNIAEEIPLYLTQSVIRNMYKLFVYKQIESRGLYEKYSHAGTNFLIAFSLKQIDTTFRHIKFKFRTIHPKAKEHGKKKITSAKQKIKNFFPDNINYAFNSLLYPSGKCTVVSIKDKTEGIRAYKYLYELIQAHPELYYIAVDD